MDSSRDSVIETTPPPAVSSLRSRFEQLAVDASSSRTQFGLLSVEPLSPRPRTISGTQASRPQNYHLRSASSDLNIGMKRPPPPPPPRVSIKPGVSSASPSPSASPLLRPVPTPNFSPSHSSTAQTGASPERTSLMRAEGEMPSTLTLGGVASLRSRFTNSPVASPPRTQIPLHTPRQSISNSLPTCRPDYDLVDLHTPALPPRQVRSIDCSSVSGNDLEQIPSSTEILPKSPHIQNNSPFSDGRDSDSSQTSSPSPSLPPRRHRPPPVPAANNSTANSIHQQQSSESTISSSSSLMLASPESDDTSIDFNFPKANSAHPSRPSVVVPPPPPPRPKTNRGTMNSDSPTSASSLQTPPPLPIRRSTAAPLEDSIHLPPPRLPVRPSTAAPEVIMPERKPSGFGRLPPPPTRTIALGEKLPPARRPPTPSSEEDSGDETDLKSGGTDQLPDSSRSSRRPPILDCFIYDESKIQVPAHSGQVAVSGIHVVVAFNHYLKVFDLSVSDSPIWSLDTKSMHMKDSKITSLEFRPAARADDRGFFLWIGTKEGHLFEVDVRTGNVTASKHAAHGHCITHIFRHGRSMITLDHSGKVLIFTPDEQEDVQLANSQPRVFRIPEKQEFAKILGGLLWTSTRADMAGSAPTSKMPIVRVYDVFSQGSTGRSIQPTEHVGAVTSGSILPSQPQNVYLGHEGGFISIWSIVTNDGIPQCIEVMKVSASDVLSLEGVGERLWAGGRKGTISAYDVVPRPWLVTNAWNAHPGLPVLRLATDVYSIEKLERLTVVSVGRDEQLRLWDGLLGSDWIDQELLKRESSFSTFRNLNLLIVSWNIDAAKPDTLTHDAANINFLRDVLSSVDSPDIISFGFQEVIDLESRKMTAKTVLLGGKKKGSDDGKISEKVTSSYKRWHDSLVTAVRLAMPPNSPYTVIETENLVGLFSCMFIKNTERASLKDITITTIKRGMGGRYGNKGGIVARFTIDDSSICMINCHLAAGQHHVRQRNADVAAMVEEKSVFPAVGALDEAVAYIGGGDGSMVMDHEIVFVNGDMNYRINHRRDPIITAIQAGDFNMLIAHDQLTKEMKFNRGFRFRSFSEGPLTFAPTYKYDRHSAEYDTSEKRRLPAWCDRILWRSQEPNRVKQLHYRRWEANVSDHRPISAGFTMTVKSVRHELRAVAKAEVHGIWVEHQRQLLLAAKEYYVNQALI